METVFVRPFTSRQEGRRCRVRLSNVFGDEPLAISSAFIEVKGQGHSRPLLFETRPGVLIPQGAEYVSDALDVSFPNMSEVVVSLQIAKPPKTLTVHGGARATSQMYAGLEVLTSTKPIQMFTRWYFLSAVEVQEAGTNSSSLVAFGDSITDGRGANTDKNERWTDVLAARLTADRRLAITGVVNKGIGGNCVLRSCLGPSALARFDRDVLGVAGIKAVLILEGVNDLGGLDRQAEHSEDEHKALVIALETAMHQMVLSAHAHGIKMYAGTLTPFQGNDYYHPLARTESDRAALNMWIRGSGAFDGVVDFDAVIKDPANPNHLAPFADSGDHLHPGPAGYRAMGQAVPILWFQTDHQ